MRIGVSSTASPTVSTNGDPFRGVVEVRNRLVEPRPRQIDQIALKLPERLRGLKRLFRTLQKRISPCVLDVDIGAPVVAALILDKGTVGPGPEQPQRALARLGVTGADLAQQVFRDPVHVAHDLFRIPEDVMVDPLQRVMQPHAALIVSKLVSIVHMAAAHRDANQKIAVDDELRTDGTNFILHQSIHTLSPVIVDSEIKPV